MTTSFLFCHCLSIIASFFLVKQVYGDDLQSFGFKLADDAYSTTTSDVTITAWFDHTIYECTVQPTDSDTAYSCTVEPKTVLGETCLDQDSEYKMMIDNNSTDAILIDYLFIFVEGNETSGDSEHRISGWCIDSDNIRYTAFEFSENHCAESYTNYDILCIDNDAADCGPGRVVSHFDLWTPPWPFSYFVQSIENGVSLDATNLEIETCVNEHVIPSIVPTTTSSDGVTNLVIISSTTNHNLEAASTESTIDGSTHYESDEVFARKYVKEIVAVASSCCILICICAVVAVIQRNYRGRKLTLEIESKLSETHSQHSQQNTASSVASVATVPSQLETSGGSMEQNLSVVIDPCQDSHPGLPAAGLVFINDEPESCGEELFETPDIDDQIDHTIGRTTTGTSEGNTRTGRDP